MGGTTARLRALGWGWAGRNSLSWRNSRGLKGPPTGGSGLQEAELVADRIAGALWALKSFSASIHLNVFEHIQWRLAVNVFNTAHGGYRRRAVGNFHRRCAGDAGPLVLRRGATEGGLWHDWALRRAQAQARDELYHARARARLS